MPAVIHRWKEGRFTFENCRGAVVYSVVRYIQHRRPKAYVLESVAGVVTMEGGRCLQYIIGMLAAMPEYRVT